ncbi:MAG: hypothetical protein O6931_05760 [Gammaproteobacteria bacterium]|nr:hypothetical protein [Gammaproteobacteria bacterium]
MDGANEASDRYRWQGRLSDADRYLIGKRSPLEGKVLRLPAGMQPADGFAIRLQPPFEPLEKTIRRLAPLIASGKKVTLDLSSAGFSTADRAPDCAGLLEPLASVSQALAARSLSLESTSIVVSSDHPDTPALAARTRLGEGPRRLVICISDEFLRAVQFDRELATNYNVAGNATANRAGAPSPRKIWWSWLEQIVEQTGLDLFIEHSGRSLPDLNAQCLASVAWPLLIKAPDYGAQIVMELDLAALNLSQLWRPGCLTHDLVRVVDRLLETTQWPSASIALHATRNKHAVLWLRGLLPLSRRLSRCPTVAGDRLREIIEAFRRSLVLASRRYFVEKAGHHHPPGWIAEIDCPDLRQQVSSRLKLSGARPSISMAISPWDLLPDERGSGQASQTYLFPLLSSADLLVWQIPERLSMRKERLDCLFRMAWAAKKRCNDRPVENPLFAR